MEKKTIKSLSAFNFKESSLKLNNETKKFKKEVFNLNFLCDNKELKKEKHNEKTIKKNKTLIVKGINWKTFRAIDIYSLLKPFELEKGDLKSVSLIRFYTSLSEKNEYKLGSFKTHFSPNNVNQSSFEKSLTFSKIVALIASNSENFKKNLYKNCNGLEIGNGVNTLDIRLIDLSLQKKFFVLETADSVPKNYFPRYMESECFSRKKIIKKKNQEVNLRNSKNQFLLSDQFFYRDKGIALANFSSLKKYFFNTPLYEKTTYNSSFYLKNKFLFEKFVLKKIL